MIPHQNVDDLMLNPEVVRAVKAGEFHVYSVQSIDEGIEILTGVSAGKKDEDSNYPHGSVNYLVDMRVNELAKGLKDYFWVNGTARKNTGS